MKARDKLQKGNFNSMDAECLSDGTQIILLHKEGEHKSYRLHVRNLYGENEEILEDEEVHD